MRYTLIDHAGNHLRTEQFDGPPPTLAAAKGLRWIPVPLVIVQAERLAELAAMRFVRETAGIIVAGQRIATDRASQALLTGAWCRVQQAPETLIDWKGITGWVQLDKADIEAIAAAVGHHVESCFSHERTLAEQIGTCQSVAEVEAVDITGGWPA